jgi:hypothetical protein
MLRQTVQTQKSTFSHTNRIKQQHTLHFPEHVAFHPHDWTVPCTVLGFSNRVANSPVLLGLMMLLWLNPGHACVRSNSMSVVCQPNHKLLPLTINLPTPTKGHGITAEDIALVKAPAYAAAHYPLETLHLHFFIMFQELGLMETFRIDPEVLHFFFLACHNTYRDNHYHNFHHAMEVTQFAFYVISQSDHCNGRLSSLTIFG